MPHTTFMAAPSNATDELFRTWGKGLSDAIASIALVRVPVPGTVNWATVLAPTVELSYPAREVFRFNDDLQGTHPIYLALEYGSSSTVGGMGLRLTLGKGVSVGGVITDPLLTNFLVGMTSGFSASAVSSIPTEHAVSTCPGRACIAFVSNATSSAVAAPPAFIIERSRDNEGQATGAGLSVAAMRDNAAAASASIPPNPLIAIAYDSAQSNEGPIPVVVPYRIAGTVAGSASSLATGVIAPVLPWLAFAPGVAPWQPLAGLTYAPGDAVPGAVITARLLGRDRRYRVVPIGRHHGWGVSLRPFTLAADSALTTTRQAGLMFLWED